MATVQTKPATKTESGLLEEKGRRKHQRQKMLRSSLKAYLFIAPALLILFVFHFVPIFYAFFLSLYSRISAVRGIVPPAENFAGFNNYTRLLTDPNWWNAFFNTIGYAFGVVVFGLLGALGVALLLQKVSRGKGFYRTAFFLPNVTSLIAAGAIWKLIFSSYSSNALTRPDPNKPGGLLNWIFSGFGLPMQRWLLEDRGIFTIMFNNGQRVDLFSALWRLVVVALLISGVVWLGRNYANAWAGWLTALLLSAVIFLGWGAMVELAHTFNWSEGWAGPSLAMICIIVIAIWYNLGFNIIIILAGLVNVPRELYEAAEIDGARGWSMFWRMTIPLLSPTLFFLLIISTISAFQSFTVVYAIYGPSPNRSTNVLSLFYYTTAFRQGSGQETAGFGYASAIVILMLVMIMVLSYFQQRLLGKRVNYD
jgi:multiple sugar transport system permease protein